MPACAVRECACAVRSAVRMLPKCVRDMADDGDAMRKDVQKMCSRAPQMFYVTMFVA